MVACYRAIIWLYGNCRKTNFKKYTTHQNGILDQTKIILLAFQNDRNFKKIKPIKVEYLKTNIKIFESAWLKLSNNKSKNLGWKPKWSIQESIDKVIEWNDLKKQNIHPKKICEYQIKNYLK